MLANVTRGDSVETARERLANAMDKRRLELRIRWNEVARRARMDPANVRRIRKGEIPVTSDAAYALEEALDWPHGRIDQLLNPKLSRAELRDLLIGRLADVEAVYPEIHDMIEKVRGVLDNE